MESGSNSKMLLIGGAALVLVAVVLGIRTLTGPADEPSEKKPVVEKKQVEEGDESDSKKGSSARGSKVTSLGSGNKETPRVGTAKATGSNFTGFKYEDTTAPVATPVQVAQVTPAAATPTPTAEENEEAKENARKVSDLVSMFKNEKDPSARIDLADEIGLIDDPTAVRQLLALAETETDPEVKEALLNALTGLDALEELGPEAVAALEKYYRTSGELDVRIAAMDALGDIATAESKKVLWDIYQDPTSDPAEKLNAAENVLRIGTNDPQLLTAEERQKIGEQLKLDFQAGSDAAFRSQAAMALALLGKESLPFFQDALTKEQDPNVKNLLEKLSKMQFGPQ